MLLKKLVCSLIVLFSVQMGEAISEQKQTFTFAFPQLSASRSTYTLCQKAIQLHPGYSVNFAGQAKNREAIDNALAQMILSGWVSAEGMHDMTYSRRKMNTLYLGKASGFYASVDDKIFCLYSKK